MIRDQHILDLSCELIIDNFACGGGASHAIEMALGRHVDVAINHDRDALAMHEANHPQTKHFPEDVFAVDPIEVTAGRAVGLAWFSPDCTHFSKARGMKPRSKKIRGLAWVILRWAVLARPRVIIMENVEEFLSWGPLATDGQPCPFNKGRTFRTFKDAFTTGIAADNPDVPEIIEVLGNDFPVARLFTGLGYAFEHRELRACDYGALLPRAQAVGRKPNALEPPFHIMRNISCSLTTPQVRARTKDVTRRLGWEDLKPGDQLQACEKCMGRRNGEPLVRLCIIEVVSVRRETLRRMLRNPVYGRNECRREGFPFMSPAEFVAFFCASHTSGKKKCTADTPITRIEFRYR